MKIIIVILVFTIFVCGIGYLVLWNKYQDQLKKDFTVQNNNDKIKQEKENLLIEIQSARLRVSDIEKEYQSKKQLINDAGEKASQEYKTKCELLNKQYEDKINEYNQEVLAFTEEQEKMLAELNELKATKAAVIEAFQREESIKQEKDLYRLNISKNESNDIELLRSIQFKLTNSRILCMLIWQTYFQPKAKKKFPVILKQNKVCGIYKITNSLNQKTYIGQAKDVYRRWCDHIKAGLGVDTPQGNKLYAAMLEEGVENFTFELLEECAEERLNAAEAYYIDLYNSVTWGYNSQKGKKIE
jgi:hypothetical protein